MSACSEAIRPCMARFSRSFSPAEPNTTMVRLPAARSVPRHSRSPAKSCRKAAGVWAWSTIIVKPRSLRICCMRPGSGLRTGSASSTWSGGGSAGGGRQQQGGGDVAGLHGVADLHPALPRGRRAAGRPESGRSRRPPEPLRCNRPPPPPWDAAETVLKLCRRREPRAQVVPRPVVAVEHRHAAGAVRTIPDHVQQRRLGVPVPLPVTMELQVPRG